MTRRPRTDWTSLAITLGIIGCIQSAILLGFFLGRVT